MNNHTRPRDWSTAEVVRFLRANDFAEFEEEFEKAGVTGKQLVVLADAELTKLGLRLIKQRKRFLKNTPPLPLIFV